MKCRWLPLTAALVLCAVDGWTAPPESADVNPAISVDADRLRVDRERDTVVAEGDVVVTRGATLLGADWVEIDRRASTGAAKGSLVIEDPRARLRGDSAWLDLDDEVGYLDDAELFLPESRFRLKGKRIEKEAGPRYRIWGGSLTTCLCEDGAPDWSLEGSVLDVELDGWAEARDVVFRVKGTPILWLPWARVPVESDRETGLLFPTFGISNARGFQMVQPFFWAIDKSQDLTVSLDVETGARIGLLTDYEYALAPNQGGVLSLSYFNESIGGRRGDEVVDPEELANPTIPENRGSVIGHHDQILPDGTRFWARPFLVSDNLFLRDMNTLTWLPAQSLNLTTLRYTTSQIGLLHRLPGGTAMLEAKWFQDLIQKQSRVPQPLPHGRVNLQTLLLDRFRLGFMGDGVYYYRAPLSSGGRLVVAPQITMPWRTGPYAFGSVGVTLNETVYGLVNNDVPVFPQNPNGTLPTREVPRFQHRETLQVNANGATELARVYEVEGMNLRRLKHTVEPFLRYAFAPQVDQNDLPLWDWMDRINARNIVTYGVGSRLLGKFGTLTALPVEETVGAVAAADGPVDNVGGEIRELARGWIQQSYSLGPPIVLDLEGNTAQVSGVDVGMRVTPTSWAGIQGRTVVAVQDPGFAFAEVGGQLTDPRPIVGESDLFLAALRPVNSASMYYQFTSGGEISNVNLATTFRVTDHVALSWLGRFDLQVSRFLENWVGLRLISGCDCWVVDLNFVDRVNPNEVEVRVQFSLVGLGSFGQQPFGSGPGFFPPPEVGRQEQSGLYGQDPSMLYR